MNSNFLLRLKQIRVFPGQRLQTKQIAPLSLSLNQGNYNMMRGAECFCLRTPNTVSVSVCEAAGTTVP